MQRDYGYSTPCSTCMANLGTCTKTHCLSAALSGDEAEAKKCMAAHCIAPFIACAGTDLYPQMAPKLKQLVTVQAAAGACSADLQQQQQQQQQLQAASTTAATLQAFDAAFAPGAVDITAQAVAAKAMGSELAALGATCVAQAKSYKCNAVAGITVVFWVIEIFVLWKELLLFLVLRKWIAFHKKAQQQA